LATVYFYAGAAFTMLELKQKTVDYLDKSFELRKSSKTDYSFTYFYMFYGYRLIDNNELEKAVQMFEIGKSLNVGNSELLNSEGYLFMARGQFEKAIEKFYDRNELHNINRGEPDKTNRYTNYYIAYCFNKLANFQESNRFALASYRQSEGSGFEGRNLNNASLLLADNYDNLGQIQKAFFYLKRYTDIVKKNDLQLATDRTAEIEIQAIVNKSVYEKEILEKEKVEQERVNQTQRWWIFSIAAGLISLLLVLYLLLKNNQNKQKANNLLQNQKEEIDLQRDKAESALENLKSTQAQLIQSEKMASLGELTAGISP
jgi:two-component system, NtrC family, sensor kinase